MSNKMWGGRFGAEPDAIMEEINASIGVDHLGYYADPSAKVFQDLKAVGWAFGMPTTVLVDPQGCDLAVLAGPAEWTSEDALKLVTAALGG